MTLEEDPQRAREAAEKVKAQPGIPENFEEYRVLPQWMGWVILVLMSAGLLSWGMWLHHMVEEAPRYFDVGHVPDAPGESIHSTERAPAGPTSRPQIAPLPEGDSTRTLEAAPPARPDLRR